MRLEGRRRRKSERITEGHPSRTGLVGENKLCKGEAQRRVTPPRTPVRKSEKVAGFPLWAGAPRGTWMP
jgi:hypothetical protein